MRRSPLKFIWRRAGFQQYPKGATVMNVARSTFMRKGYLLTALAVAVLLAGSSGTSWAQTIRFSTSRASLQWTVSLS